MNSPTAPPSRGSTYPVGPVASGPAETVLLQKFSGLHGTPLKSNPGGKSLFQKVPNPSVHPLKA